MTDPTSAAAQEAAAVTEAALALAGHELDPFTRDITDKMGRGELTGDEAAEAIIAHFAGSSQPV
ncbi:MAG: antitoxin VbhA family protein [Mycobacteriaceae bacterium]|nr:antitoxin VbhA family protein [Mycobacteriaceae bacterium]